MPLPFLAQLAIGVGLQILGALLLPQPKQPKPPEVEDLDSPTMDAGRPIPKVFGSMTVKGLAILDYMDTEIDVRSVPLEK